MVKKECDECGRQLKIEYIDERGETSEVKLTREDVPYAVCPTGHGRGHALSLWKSGGLIEDWFREHCAENEGFLFWESLRCRTCGRKLDGDGYELPAAVEGPLDQSPYESGTIRAEARMLSCRFCGTKQFRESDRQRFLDAVATFEAMGNESRSEAEASVPVTQEAQPFDRLPTVPKTLLPPFGVLLQKIENLPAWLQPVVWGPLIVIALTLLNGGIIVIPAAIIYYLVQGTVPISPLLFGAGLFVLLLVGAAAGGLAYGLLGRRLLETGAGGRQLAGWISVLPYIVCIDIFLQWEESGKFFSHWEPHWIGIGIMTLFLGSVIGHSCFGKDGAFANEK